MSAASAGGPYLHSYKLYETRSNFYLIGTDKCMTVWRVLKIDRSEPDQLNVWEDPELYSESECKDLLIRLHEGNKPNGGLKFITNCYGIIGFVKFLGPYYMMLVTQRRKIGDVCGHDVYGISKSEMLEITNPNVSSNTDYAKDEKRYKKLLCTIDLTKDFFFSYSYPIMHSIQKNFCSGENRRVLYDTMFVWNAFLTRRVRNHLKNNIWTVALVFGSFEQIKIPIYGKDLKLTLIARRSRYFAGTRYLKRGVNEKGRVANDVETEQIVSEDTSMQISSVVQVRGSIPLFWSQEASWINVKPDIVLHKKDQYFRATRLHFDNLVKRYGNPIIILNLIKEHEKKPRECLLLAELTKAITFLNKNLPNKSPLELLHCDLHTHYPRKAKELLSLLGKIAAKALESTSFFYYQLSSTMGPDSLLWPLRDSSIYESEFSKEEIEINMKDVDELPMLQKGVLRTNCIDGLDRTNIAQFVFGLTALGRQLHACGVIDTPIINIDGPLHNDVMHLYERMGDTLSMQYGGSTAHKKVFAERRGQWKAARQSQELFTTIQRYYNNAYLDAKKQNAINVFLGYFRPQKDKPVIWELDSDQHYNVGRCDHINVDENMRSSLKRSLSDGNITCQISTPISCSNPGKDERSILPSYERTYCLRDIKVTSDSLIEMASENCAPDSRQLCKNCQRYCCTEYGHDTSIYSNSSGLDWLYSSGNSFEGTQFRSSQAKLSIKKLSTQDGRSGLCVTSTPTILEKTRENTSTELSSNPAGSSGSPTEFLQTLTHWIDHGSALSY